MPGMKFGISHCTPGVDAHDCNVADRPGDPSGSNASTQTPFNEKKILFIPRKKGGIKMNMRLTSVVKGLVSFIPGINRLMPNNKIANEIPSDVLVIF